MPTKKGEKLLYEKETYLIRGACFKVWKEFKGTFKESVIHKALTEELNFLGLKVEINKRINVYYRGKKIGIYIPDLIINDLILIELKRKPFLTRLDEQQFWYYLKASSYKLGFLINFGDHKLEIKRRVYDKARK
jgi:GxxExxY protein